jgi:hypothetical protein
MHNFQGSSKSSTNEEPSAKRQRLLCRTKKIELSEDEVNSSQMLLQQHQTLPTTSSGKFSTVSVSNVSNIDLRNMVTNSLPLETKSPRVNMLQNKWLFSIFDQVIILFLVKVSCFLQEWSRIRIAGFHFHLWKFSISSVLRAFLRYHRMGTLH